MAATAHLGTARPFVVAGLRRGRPHPLVRPRNDNIFSFLIFTHIVLATINLTIRLKYSH